MAKKEPAEKAVRDIRRKTRRRFSAEKKIRIVIARRRGSRKVAAWERFYNYDRPHGAHHGKTPYEALREKLC